jgi:hypothetical protein
MYLWGIFTTLTSVRPLSSQLTKSPATKSLQILLLPACPGILVEVPLDIAFLILQRPCSDLEKPHAHSGTDLRQLNSLVARLDKDMVSHFDRVFDVFESVNSLALGMGSDSGVSDLRYYSVSHLCRALPWWKEMLEDLNYPLAEFCAEPLEYQVWVTF